MYGPKAIAGIGKLPDTVADRSIPIRMKRRAPGEVVAKFRRRTAEAEAGSITMPEVDLPDVADVAVPQELPDRAADGWESLLAIADTAAGAWPARARIAAVALSSDQRIEPSVGIRLLSDVREAFGKHDYLATGDLLAALHNMDDASWGEWYGKPMSAQGLAKLLQPFGVYPVKKRTNDSKRTFRGYFRSEFEDLWDRYLPIRADATSATSATNQPIEGVRMSPTPYTRDHDAVYPDRSHRAYHSTSPPTGNIIPWIARAWAAGRRRRQTAHNGREFRTVRLNSELSRTGCSVQESGSLRIIRSI